MQMLVSARASEAHARRENPVRALWFEADFTLSAKTVTRGMAYAERRNRFGSRAWRLQDERRCELLSAPVYARQLPAQFDPDRGTIGAFRFGIRRCCNQQSKRRYGAKKLQADIDAGACVV